MSVLMQKDSFLQEIVKSSETYGNQFIHVTGDHMKFHDISVTMLLLNNLNV